MITPFSSLYSTSIMWFASNGMRILFVLIGAYLLVRSIAFVTDRFVKKAMQSDLLAGAEEERKRRDTLVRIIVRTAQIALYLIAGMMILSEFGINIGPLIAGAGIIGVAIGFGSQQLVRDVISGLFIVLENRYHVGDSVQINETTGLVEDLNLRVTKIRDADGGMHYIPNGSITSCTNFSGEGGRIHLSLKVSATVPLNRVREIIDRVGMSFASDDETNTNVRRPPKITRIEAFDPDWWTLRISGDVQTTEQWERASELKQRIKEALDAEGIKASG